MYLPNIISSLFVSSVLTPILPSGSHSTKVPLVIWHGLGDSYNSSSMQRAEGLIKEVHPDLFIHLVYIYPDAEKDSEASFFGKALVDVDYVCSQLSDVDELSNGFDAIGFSQGGLFLRAALERCKLPIHNLITFGSPHLGVREVISCEPNDRFCNIRNNFLKKQVWKSKIQNSVIPAQYFRDVFDYDNYLKYSAFLADINNEKGNINYTYSKAVKSLNQFIMVLFNQDKTLIPKESAWFGDLDKLSGRPLRFNETEIFEKDLIGIKDLHARDKLKFLAVNGSHMEITNDFLQDIAREYLGSVDT